MRMTHYRFCILCGLLATLLAAWLMLGQVPTASSSGQASQLHQ